MIIWCKHKGGKFKGQIDLAASAIITNPTNAARTSNPELCVGLSDGARLVTFTAQTQQQKSTFIQQIDTAIQVIHRK
jgi:hypothetical protein